MGNIKIEGPIEDNALLGNGNEPGDTKGCVEGIFGQYPRTQGAGQLKEVYYDGSVETPKPTGLPNQF